MCFILHVSGGNKDESQYCAVICNTILFSVLENVNSE